MLLLFSGRSRSSTHTRRRLWCTPTSRSWTTSPPNAFTRPTRTEAMPEPSSRTWKKSGFIIFDVVTHRQGRHLPRAPDFEGPLNSLMCLKKITLWGPQNEKQLHYYVFESKNSFHSQGNRITNKKIRFMGPLIYVLPRAPNGLKTALMRGPRYYSLEFLCHLLSFAVWPKCS